MRSLPNYGSGSCGRKDITWIKGDEIVREIHVDNRQEYRRDWTKQNKGIIRTFKDMLIWTS
jgi:hypothetical protein